MLLSVCALCCCSEPCCRRHAARWGTAGGMQKVAWEVAALLCGSYLQFVT